MTKLLNKKRPLLLEGLDLFTFNRLDSRRFPAYNPIEDPSFCWNRYREKEMSWQCTGNLKQGRRPPAKRSRPLSCHVLGILADLKFAACCRRQSGKASDRSSSSTRWDLLSWRPGRASMCGLIRTSVLPR